MKKSDCLPFIFLISTTFAMAQNAATSTKPVLVEYGQDVTLAMAQKLVAAARVESGNNGYTMAIAIVDTGGNLVAFEKMDNTQVGSIEIAMSKAKTANNFKRSTKVLEDAIAAGGVGLRLLAVPEMLPLEGGEPIMVNGKIIGAIGLSGMQSSQDGAVARAALAAVIK
ncbi:MAG: heme-binding protein [Chryseolinea sp.]